MRTSEEKTKAVRISRVKLAEALYVNGVPPAEFHRSAS